MATSRYKAKRNRRKGKEFYAVIVDSKTTKAGKGIKYGNIIYGSMTAAANAVAGGSIDGWLFWKTVK